MTQKSDCNSIRSMRPFLVTMPRKFKFSSGTESSSIRHSPNFSAAFKFIWCVICHAHNLLKLTAIRRLRSAQTISLLLSQPEIEKNRLGMCLVISDTLEYSLIYFHSNLQNREILFSTTSSGQNLAKC